METVNQRVKLFFVDEKKMNQAAMRKELKIKSRSQTSNWLTNEEEVPEKMLLKMIRTYPDLNANWLLRGIGPMLLSTTEETPIWKTEDPASPYVVSPCTSPACKKQLNDLIQKHEIEKERLWLHIEELTRKVGSPSENSIQGGVEETRRTG
jgi:hypothetical protein